MVLSDAHKDLAEDQREGVRALLLPSVDELEALHSLLSDSWGLKLSLYKEANNDMELLFSEYRRDLLCYLEYLLQDADAGLAESPVALSKKQYLSELRIDSSL